MNCRSVEKQTFFPQHFHSATLIKHALEDGEMQHVGLVAARGFGCSQCAGMNCPDPIKHGANEEQVTAN